jgi:hypothetical protein
LTRIPFSAEVLHNSGARQELNNCTQEIIPSSTAQEQTKATTTTDTGMLCSSLVVVFVCCSCSCSCSTSCCSCVDLAGCHVVSPQSMGSNDTHTGTDQAVLLLMLMLMLFRAKKIENERESSWE